LRPSPPSNGNSRRGWCSLFVHGMLAAMHPPDFNPNHRLSDWPACFLEATCPACGKVTIVPVRMLRGDGDAPLLAIARRLRCSPCKVPAVYLLAGRTRRFLGGPSADWALELVPGAPLK
jgi:hypothetical protein